VVLAFQWDSPIGATLTDLDIYAVDSGTTNISVASKDRNLQTAEPFELLVPVNTTGSAIQFDIMIHRFEGNTLPTRLKYVNFGYDLTVANLQYFTGAPTIFGHAAAKGAMAVGAAPYFNHSSPELFTSLGPTTFLFNANGSPIIPPEIRAKPDIAAI